VIAAREAGAEQAARRRRLAEIGAGLPKGEKHLLEREVEAGRGESPTSPSPELSLLLPSAYVGRTQALAAPRS
jgi:hypothetical protein